MEAGHPAYRLWTAPGAHRHVRAGTSRHPRRHRARSGISRDGPGSEAEPQAAEPSAEEDDEEAEGAEEDFFESAEAGTDEEEPLRESVR